LVSDSPPHTHTPELAAQHHMRSRSHATGTPQNRASCNFSIFSRRPCQKRQRLDTCKMIPRGRFDSAHIRSGALLLPLPRPCAVRCGAWRAYVVRCGAWRAYVEGNQLPALTTSWWALGQQSVTRASLGCVCVLSQHCHLNQRVFGVCVTILTWHRLPALPDRHLDPDIDQPELHHALRA
jgi:hypothetical protein